MKRAKLFFLAVVVLIFAVSSIVSSQRHSQVTNLLSVSMKSVGWAASELELELLKFIQALRRTALSDLQVEELQLRFELLWSRVDVLSKGAETEEFRGQPQALDILHRIKQQLLQIEPEIFSVNEGDRRALDILHQLKPFQSEIRAFNVDSFSGDRSWSNLKQLHRLQNEANIYLLGLLLSGGLLVLLVIRENTLNRRQALHDSLTGLPNRHFFQIHLNQAIARARSKKSRVAIHVIDMDGFKAVNDQLGHAAGDELLQVIASRLTQYIRLPNTVARLGGDEFAIIQEKVTDTEQCIQLAQEITEQINAEISVQGHKVLPEISIGISVYPDDSDQPEKLLNNADTAMYCAKNDFNVSYCLFEQEMANRKERLQILSEDLHIAIERDLLQQLYQPIVCLKTKQVVLVEALLRWQHEVYGYISPLEVVSIAEQAGLAEQLNAWVLHKACMQNMAWREAGLPQVQVSVNISPTMYTRHDLVGMVSQVLSHTGLPADQLVIEVTEDTTMQDIESSPEILHKLRQLGVELALDDFGTGYSSLSHLKKMPFQKLKIDKVFIQELNSHTQDMSFIRTIITLARGLGLQVVAEGIEVAENYQDLYQEGCEYGQGYLFSKPVASEEIESMLQGEPLGSVA